MFSPTNELRVKPEVFTVQPVGMKNGSRNRCMPPMIKPGTKNGLVDCSSNKMFVNQILKAFLFGPQHIIE